MLQNLSSEPHSCEVMTCRDWLQDQSRHSDLSSRHSDLSWLQLEASARASFVALQKGFSRVHFSKKNNQQFESPHFLKNPHIFRLIVASKEL